MEDEKEQKAREQADDKKKKKQKSQVPLPFCTTAPDPEHARGYEEEEPCDDARSGETGSTEEQSEETEEKGSTHYPRDD
jgi:hypothetical protein